MEKTFRKIVIIFAVALLTYQTSVASDNSVMIKGFWGYVNTVKSGAPITRTLLNSTTPSVKDLAVALNSLSVIKPSNGQNTAPQSTFTTILADLGRISYERKEAILLLDPTFAYQFGDGVSAIFSIKHKAGPKKIETLSSNKQTYSIEQATNNKLTISDLNISDNTVITKSFTINKLTVNELILIDNEFNEVHTFKRINF
jgi:hypothetical protein